jgi:hypothetical protein
MNTSLQIILGAFLLCIFTVQVDASGSSCASDFLVGLSPTDESHAERKYAEVVLVLLRENAEKFRLSAKDCRETSNGPKVSLEPRTSCRFIDKNGNRVHVSIFDFSSNYSVIQIEKDTPSAFYIWEIVRK